MEAWFANPTLLWFAGAACIPWLLRFLLRPKFQTYPWAATRLMAAAQARVSAQVSWLQWLLLLVQTAAVLLLALALASPLGGPQGLIASGSSTPRVWWVLVIDDSYSMQYVSDGRAHFQTAVERAVELVDRAHPQDAFSLLSTSRLQPWVIGEPSYDHASVVESLSEWQAQPRATNLERTLAALKNRVSSVSNNDLYAEIRVVFWTDLQAATWQSLESSPLSTVLSELQDQAVAEVQDLGPFGSGNVSLRGLDGIPTQAPNGKPFTIWVDVVNQDPAAVVTAAVRVSVDGRFQSETSVRLEPQETRKIQLSAQADGVGQHQVFVESSNDPLAIDHRLWAVVDVVETLQVVCWTDRPQEEPYLLQAVSSLQRSGRQVRVLLGRPEQLAGNRPRDTLLVVGSVADVSDEQAGQVKAFVEQGGGLVYFAGPTSQPWQLLGKFAEPLGDAALWKTTPATPHALNLVEPLPALTRVFQGTARDTLLQTPVWRQWIMPRPDGSSWESIIETQEGGLLLGSLRVGKGRCFFWLSGIDPGETLPPEGRPWSALAVWPSYPALLSRMIDGAAGGISQNNLMIPLLASEQDDALFGSDDWKRLTEDTAEQQSAPQTSWASLQPGVYARDLGQGQMALRAFNVDSREADSQRRPLNQLPPWFRSAPVDQSPKPTAASGPDGSRWFQWCLLGVLGLLLVEVGIVGRLQGRPTGIGKRRRSGERP